jgi:hypothetical protein
LPRRTRPAHLPIRMARKGRADWWRALFWMVPVPSRFCDRKQVRRNHSTAPRNAPETESRYGPCQLNSGVRSCLYRSSTSSTASFSSVPFPAWQYREEGYDRGHNGAPRLREHWRIPCSRIRRLSAALVLPEPRQHGYPCGSANVLRDLRVGPILCGNERVGGGGTFSKASRSGSG